MSFTEGRIVYVDPTRLCCDAIGIDGSNYYEDIQYVNSGLRQSGDILHPELGDVIVLELIEHGQARLHRYYSKRSIDENNLIQFKVGVGGVLNLNKALPGDHTITGPDGAWLNLLRGRLASIGSSPICQTLYMGLENLIRTVCQNYEVIGSGFRVFSVNDEGKITTRLCFSGSDQFVANGIIKNSDALSENYEYQIDITTDAMTFFIGEIDGQTNKRVNNLVISFEPSGNITIVVGNNILWNIYSDGACSFKVIDNNNKIVYNHSIALSKNNTVNVKEIIVGNVTRLIDGNLLEEITGSHTTNTDARIEITNSHDLTTRIKKETTSLNLKDLTASPSSGISN